MNTTLSPKFRGEILRQVYRVWLVRRFLPAFVIEIAVLSAILYKFAKLVFIQRVVENATNVAVTNPSGILQFFISAFSNAPAATKLAGLGIIILAALLLRHLTQGILRFILVKQNYFGSTAAEGSRIS